MVIVLEGLDGSGKSRCCRLLAAVLRAERWSSVPPEHAPLREDVDRNADPVEHYLFYRRGVDLTSQRLVARGDASRPVVLDRYWMTTVAYHRAMGVPACVEDFGCLIRPELTIYLEASDHIRAERLRGRGMSANDHQSLPIYHLVKREYEALLPLAGPLLRVNTDRLSSREVVCSILASAPSIR